MKMMWKDTINEQIDAFSGSNSSQRPQTQWDINDQKKYTSFTNNHDYQSERMPSFHDTNA